MPTHPSQFRKLRILVAEDNEINQKIIMLLLEKMGHSVYAVFNGEQALETLGKRRFDVVLMDVQMPVLDGLETTRRIRAELPTEEQPKIIALTAAVAAINREQCIAAGMDGFISKPVGAAQLRDALLRVSSNSVKLGTALDESGPIADDQFNFRNLEDMAKLERDGASGLLDKVVGTYQSNTRSAIALLWDAIAWEDSTALHRTAHSLKGSSRQIGATKLGDLCEQLEGSTQVEQTRKIMEKIEDGFQQTEAFLSEFCKKIQDRTGK